MITYLTCFDDVKMVDLQLGIFSEDIPPLPEEKQNTLSEIISVLAEVRRVTCNHEENRKLTMYRSPRLIHELHDTMRILAGEMSPAPKKSLSSFPSSSRRFILNLNGSWDGATKIALPFRRSTTSDDKQPDICRAKKLARRQARILASKLADSIAKNLQVLWTPV